MLRAMDSGDVEGALYMLRALASDGVAQAMAEIGVIYETGSGSVEEDMITALKWYRKAADAGDLEGLLAIARLHLTGQGVPLNYQVAREYYEGIVEQIEDRRALFGLAWIFHEGLGVSQDHARAEGLYKRAISAGHVVAPKWLASLYWSNRRFIKAVWFWLVSMWRIWRTTIFDRKSLKLHRQL